MVRCCLSGQSPRKPRPKAFQTNHIQTVSNEKVQKHSTEDLMEIVTSNKKLSEKYARVESKIQEQIKSKPGKNKESHLSQETLKLIEIEGI